jgi:hypothetical protein
MKRLIVLVVLLLLIVFDGTASSAEETCEDVVAAFLHNEHALWLDAGEPTYVCDVPDVDGQLGLYVASTNTVHLPTWAPLTHRVIAHETGHAWAYKHRISMTTYAALRGLPRGDSAAILRGDMAWFTIVHEDYAETFAWSIGRMPDVPGLEVPPPYAFQTTAGAPTVVQVEALRAADLLPSQGVMVLTAPSCGYRR